MTAASSPLPEVGKAHCLTHPEWPAVGACTRCGTFFCSLDRRTIQERDYCASCAERPDVNYLELFRLQCWGRRDLWGWTVGYFGLICLIFGPQMLFARSAEGRPLGWVFIGGGVVGLCFWKGLKYARLALCIASAIAFISVLLIWGRYVFWAGAIQLVSSIFIYNDPRTRLFFREEISEETLRKMWNVHKNNPSARTGFLLSLLGLGVPLVSPIALVCSLVGLFRVDPSASPPIGRRRQAIAGIVLSVVGIVWGATFAAVRYYGA